MAEFLLACHLLGTHPLLYYVATTIQEPFMVMQTVVQPAAVNVIPGAGIPKFWSTVISDVGAAHPGYAACSGGGRLRGVCDLLFQECPHGCLRI